MKTFLAILFFTGFSCSAQELPLTTQQQLENIGDEVLEDDALLLQLNFYLKHPVNLNTATAEELHSLRSLTDLQIANLMRYRVVFGKLLHIYELQAVPGFDLLTIKKIQPYVFAGAAVAVKESLFSRFLGGEQYALLRAGRILEKAKGYDTSLNSHYPGDRNHLLFRYRYQYKTSLYYGMVADKDAGEQFFKGAQKMGFDFYSFHFFARDLGKIKALALGDYVVNLGQGLTQWQSLGFGKSVDVMNIKRQSAVLLPYRSAGEFNFNRGAAATITFSKFEATGFVSYKKFSGNLKTDSVDRFTSFGTSGYYRTKSEVADRYKLSDFSFGGNVSYQSGSLKLGVTSVVHRFSRPMQKRDEPYNFFAFTGQQSLNASMDYSYTYNNMHLFGEVAVDKNLATAFLQGALISVDPKIDISILYRNLSPQYSSLFGNAFTENTLPGNEKGLYAGITIRPVYRWQLAAYADFYEAPFLKYRVNAATRGCDYLVQLSYLPDKHSEIYLRYRLENKPINEAGTRDVINYPVEKPKQNLRLHYATQINEAISLKGRTELLWFDKKGKEAEEGFLTYVEASFQAPYKITGNLRFQFFETGGYNSRIYAYESDVLYSFSIPAFADKVFRYYFIIKYDANKTLAFWLRMAQTTFKEKQFIGSGLDEIRGNKRT
ncbi:MAG TPA: helix-hairpin-helix domain-containing protein, partial [Flavisolibacter sp.]|nr:helix-hairpin-helix domain-containing protein [Flavisolibacter sp.]